MRPDQLAALQAIQSKRKTPSAAAKAAAASALQPGEDRPTNDTDAAPATDDSSTLAVEPVAESEGVMPPSNEPAEWAEEAAKAVGIRGASTAHSSAPTLPGLVLDSEERLLMALFVFAHGYVRNMPDYMLVDYVNALTTLCANTPVLQRADETLVTQQSEAVGGDGSLDSVEKEGPVSSVAARPSLLAACMSTPLPHQVTEMAQADLQTLLRARSTVRVMDGWRSEEERSTEINQVRYLLRTLLEGGWDALDEIRDQLPADVQAVFTAGTEAGDRTADATSSSEKKSTAWWKFKVDKSQRGPSTQDKVRARLATLHYLRSEEQRLQRQQNETEAWVWGGDCWVPRAELPACWRYLHGIVAEFTLDCSKTAADRRTRREAAATGSRCRAGVERH